MGNNQIRTRTFQTKSSSSHHFTHFIHIIIDQPHKSKGFMSCAYTSLQGVALCINICIYKISCKSDSRSIHQVQFYAQNLVSLQQLKLSITFEGSWATKWECWEPAICYGRRCDIKIKYIERTQESWKLKNFEYLNRKRHSTLDDVILGTILYHIKFVYNVLFQQSPICTQQSISAHGMRKYC